MCRDRGQHMARLQIGAENLIARSESFSPNPEQIRRRKVSARISVSSCSRQWSPRRRMNALSANMRSTLPNGVAGIWTPLLRINSFNISVPLSRWPFRINYSAASRRISTTLCVQASARPLNNTVPIRSPGPRWPALKRAYDADLLEPLLPQYLFRWLPHNPARCERQSRSSFGESEDKVA